MPTKPPKIIALGEILWDMFPTGPRFGGAPANFSMHAASLGASVSILSCVGKDKIGNEAINLLRDASVDTTFVAQSEEHATGTVSVDIDPDGHAQYRFHDDEAWDHIRWIDGLQEAATSVDAVCFGTLAQRGPESKTTIRRFLQATDPETLRVLDLNLREPFYNDEVIDASLRFANVLKLNDDELAFLAKMYSFSGDEISLAKQLAEKFELTVVALTRGSRGGAIVVLDQVSEVPAQPTKVRDTVGAGDSFTAAVVVGLLKKMPLDEINRAACRIAEYVCTQPGATPKLPEDLLMTWNQ